MFRVYSFLPYKENIDLTRYKKKVHDLGFEKIVIDVSDIDKRKIRKYFKDESEFILRWHLKYEGEEDRRRNRERVRKFINRVYYDIGRDYCSLYSIDEDYAEILSPNELRYFDIIRLKKYNYRTINRYIRHNFLFEIFLDVLLGNIKELWYTIPRIKIIENKEKILVSQTKPIFKALEIPIVYYTILNNRENSFREVYTRINLVIERCL